MDGRAVSPGTDAWITDGHLSYRAGIDGVECSLTYTSWKGEPALQITLTNRGHVPFQPVKAGLRMGIDTYMDTYPEWFGKYFPTLMRNEKTHFTGYLQTPSGHTLGLVYPQPVASWSVEYNLGYQDPAPHWFMGHRIESLNIDLLNALPLPSRNPQDLWCLRQGESRSWTIVLIDIEAPGQFETELSSIADIPMIRMERTGYGAGETAVFDVLGDSPQVIVTDDSGRQMDLAVGKVPGAEGEMTFEDGMISCSALQIGMLALLQEDTAARKHYTRAMLDILRSHDCLAQLRVPDARRRGGTMRYWEAQYDVQMLPNMFNSPHGWSGWRAYATYYAYLLTGEERWLTETFNAACAFSNLIDYRTGDLRWAFVVDPYLRVTQACSADSHVTADSLSFGNPHPRAVRHAQLRHRRAVCQHDKRLADGQYPGQRRPRGLQVHRRGPAHQRLYHRASRRVRHRLQLHRLPSRRHPPGHSRLETDYPPSLQPVRTLDSRFPGLGHRAAAGRIPGLAALVFPTQAVISR